MRVKMKSTAASPEGVFMEDGTYPVPDELGKAWIDGGYAVQVDEPIKEVTPEAETSAEVEGEVSGTEVDNTAGSGTGEPTGGQAPPTA